MLAASGSPGPVRAWLRTVKQKAGRVARQLSMCIALSEDLGSYTGQLTTTTNFSFRGSITFFWLLEILHAHIHNTTHTQQQTPLKMKIKKKNKTESGRPEHLTSSSGLHAHTWVYTTHAHTE